MTEPPLTGLRVVEWSCSIAGAYCGRLFADLGAQVIKVEPPDGDPLRRLGPFPGGTPDPERSGLFVYFHGGKQSVIFDAGTDAAGSLPARLLGDADVLIEDWEGAAVGRDLPGAEGAPGKRPAVRHSP